MNFKHPFKWRHFQSGIMLAVQAVDELKADQSLPKTTELQPVKYLNNVVKQDHRFIKRLVNPGMGFVSFNTSQRTLRGYEAMNTIRKG